MLQKIGKIDHSDISVRFRYQFIYPIQSEEINYLAQNWRVRKLYFHLYLHSVVYKIYWFLVRIFSPEALGTPLMMMMEKPSPPLYMVAPLTKKFRCLFSIQRWSVKIVNFGNKVWTSFSKVHIPHTSGISVFLLLGR